MTQSKSHTCAETPSEWKSRRFVELVEQHGAIIAYTKPQFESRRKEGVHYLHIDSMDLFVPSDRVVAFMEAMTNDTKTFRQKELELFGRDALILRELNALDSFAKGNMEEAAEVLEAYGIEYSEVMDVYLEEAMK